VDTYQDGHDQKPWICILNFSAKCHRYRDINISSFCGCVAISVCRSLLQSLVDTFLELVMVLNSIFAGILMLSVII